MLHRLARNSISALPASVTSGDALRTSREPISPAPGCSGNDDFVTFAIDEADGLGRLLPLHRLIDAQRKCDAATLKQLHPCKAFACPVPERSLAQWLCAQCCDEGLYESIDELSRSVTIAQQCGESGEARESPARSEAFTIAPQCRYRVLPVPVSEDPAHAISRTALRGWIASQRGNVGMNLHCEGPDQNRPGGGGGAES